MISVKVDGEIVKLAEGSYLLHAARKAGTDIPALCHYEGLGHFTSCMVCVVKDAVSGDLIPSCSVPVEEGMEIITLDEEVYESRKAALELLLSDHTGDCQAPCQLACPAHMNIPLMNRLLSRGKVNEALGVVEKDIPIPSVLGRICRAPCEGACRRKTIDEAVSVCLLKRYAGDFGKSPEKNKPGTVPNGKSGNIAVIGAGPAGLSAAYYLQQTGHSCTLFDKNEQAGGLLHEARKDEDHYRKALAREVKQILDTGIEFKPGIQVKGKLAKEILHSFDAVILATGELNQQTEDWGVEYGPSGFQVDRTTYRTSVPEIFAIGNAVRPVRSAVRSVGNGKEVAVSVDQLIKGKEVTGYPKVFNSRFGKLIEEEYSEYLKEAIPDGQVDPDKGEQEGYNLDEVKKEASRCMHCDCRDIDNCLLRIFSDQHNADQKRFNRENRRAVSKNLIHDAIIYEESKCIKCGICVRLTEIKKEKFGFTFIGRGFDVRIGTPFDEKLRPELVELAQGAATACPTGALSKIKKY